MFGLFKSKEKKFHQETVRTINMVYNGMYNRADEIADFVSIKISMVGNKLSLTQSAAQRFVEIELSKATLMRQQSFGGQTQTPLLRERDPEWVKAALWESFLIANHQNYIETENLVVNFVIENLKNKTKLKKFKKLLNND